MRITLLTIGKIKEKYLVQGIAEFCKRLTPYCRLEIVELEEERLPDNPSPAQVQITLEKEGERLLKHLRSGSYLMVLDLHGTELTSEDFSLRLQKLALKGDSEITFLIGGPFGLSEAVRKAARERISFSKMTFTHQMIRLLLVEQLYRAMKIWRGEPYHL